MPAVMLLLFAFTIFLSAALLFLLELMGGKLMLPLLGGSPAVWNTCMVFYQAVLLAGYAYAHFTTKNLGPRRQAMIHLVVLVLPLLFFAIAGPLVIQGWLVQGREGNPIFASLLVLTASIGIPVFVICTSASVLTRWFSATDHPAASDPYFLYAASNLGSMIGLGCYPFMIEPNLTLSSQRFLWCFGFAILAALTAGCAFLMWNSKAPATNDDKQPGTDAGGRRAGATEQITSGPSRNIIETVPPLLAPHKPVTWIRRLRWLTLAAVPSSLMLGATTYMSMDIAAIPLLWVLPLMLYLLTFIIVFSVFDVRTQNITVAACVWLLLMGLGLLVAPDEAIKQPVIKTIANTSGIDLEPYIGAKWFPEGSSILLLIRLGVLGAAVWTGWIFTLRDKELIHHVMVMVMPLLILLLMFIMYAEIAASIWVKIALHLVALFIVAMVCHGEMARDRPEPEHLTDFFLTMSVGGVVGGLFNSLAAPIMFNSYIEYQIAMMVACLLVPPLGLSKDSKLARSADLALCAVFFLVGGLLLTAFLFDFFPKDKPSSYPKVKDMPWEHWNRAILVFLPGLLFGILAAWKGWGTPPAEEGEKPQNSLVDRALDLLLPLGLLVLVLGLFWGLPSDLLEGRVDGFAKRLQLEPEQFRNILIFGLPAVLCYTFVERNIRFGLGVGAIMLAAGMSLAIREGCLYQDRSFFGVLKVELGRSFYPEDRRSFPIQARYFVNRLVHGTTLHGKQFLEDDLRNLPTSYYHATGPVGMVMRGYNRFNEKEKRWPGIAVIGLGTGTVAAYANAGQRLDYYDIDQVVVDISYNQRRYFTFCEDAKKRGVDIGLILGDARLTCDPSNPLNKQADPEKRGLPRLRPMERWDEEKSEYRNPPPQPEYGPKLMADDKYGMIFADAFSSDAIPVHLITREAMMIYLRRLEKDGIILVHISNRYLDLQPVLANIVTDLRENGVRDEKGNVIEEVPNLVSYHMSDDDEIAPGKSRSHWVAITRDVKNIERLLQVPMWQADEAQLECLGAALWPSTDPAMTAASGLALACRGISDTVARKAFEDENRTGPYVARSKWVPIDTLHDIDARNEADQKELEKLTKDLEPIRAKLADTERLLKALDKDYEPLKLENEAAEKNVESLTNLMKDGRAGDKAEIGRKLEEAKRKIAEIKPKFQKATEEKEQLTSNKTYWTERRDPLASRVNRLKARIESLEERRKKIAKVGVWTDDYSNLLSVFNR
ncbi:MAG: hypothetical protein EBV06_00605 [Planctomycetia bacterium]|nr:hypothetical protein [Planctomycetia bacterium]